MCGTGNPEDLDVRILKSQTGTFSTSVFQKKDWENISSNFMLSFSLSQRTLDLIFQCGFITRFLCQLVIFT